MLIRQDIICLSSIDWDFIWQGHQEIMATLARNGNRVLFVENTGVRRPTFRDLPRLRQRIRNWWRGSKGFRQERDNLIVYSPLILPFPYSCMARWLNRLLLLRSLRRGMKAIGFKRPVIWTFLPTPLACDVIRALDPELTIYYCIDDLASSSPQARRIVRSETQLFREADLVFVTSEKLREQAAQFRDRVHLFPFGVNYQKFEQVRQGSEEPPADLRDLPGPVVGYVGGVHQWIDQELVATVASRLSEVSFALVGPLQTDVSRMARCANVHLLGARSHFDVPRYIKAFDVGVIPYRLSEYTANVYPTKLNEYLAMGIPVVATNLPEIRRFNAEYGGVVAVAQDAETFSKAILEEIKRKSSAVTERRIEVARRNSWEERIAQMESLIEEALKARRAATGRWEAIFRRLYQTAHRQLVWTVAGAVAVYLFLFYTSFIWVVAEPLRFADPPQPADAIVVLAGGIGESGEPGEEYQEKVEQGVKLYREGYAQRIIFSSGVGYVYKEAQVMKALAVSLGVSESAIILDKRGGGNYASLLNAKRILETNGWTRMLLVTSRYNTARSRLVVEKNLPAFQVRFTPAPRSVFFGDRGPVAWKHVRAILHEYGAIVYYRLKGYI